MGAKGLSHLAEILLAGGEMPDGAIDAEIAPVFVERDGARTDTVVLACTHYPFLQGVFERLAPWLVAWIYPAPAIARRLATLILDAPAGQGSLRYLSTPPPRRSFRAPSMKAGTGKRSRAGFWTIGI